jgi:hypothetical protein
MKHIHITAVEAGTSGHLQEHHAAGLRRDALPFVETLAQSIANIAPTVTPALAIPLVFASSGHGTWLTYLLATVGLLLVSLCINQFARRSATPGSLYSYTTAGFVAKFAQEVRKGQWPWSVEGIRQPGSRTVRPQCGPRLQPPAASVVS